MFLKMHFKKAEKSFLKGNILVPKRHSISLTQKNHLNYYKMCRCISNVPSFFFWLDSSSSKRSRSGGLATASNSIYVNLLRKLLLQDEAAVVYTIIVDFFSVVSNLVSMLCYQYASPEDIKGHVGVSIIIFLIYHNYRYKYNIVQLGIVYFTYKKVNRKVFFVLQTWK